MSSRVPGALAVTTCRKCPAEIIFAKTPAGAWMPVDAEPNPDGNLAECGRNDDGVLLVAPVDLFTPAGARRRMPHWATCTSPEEFRK